MSAADALPIAVAIAADRPLVHACLRRIVQSDPGLDVARETTDATSTLDALQDGRCDVLLLDLDMPAASGLELIKRVRAQWPHLSIIAVSMHNQPQIVRAALAAGADDYLPKDSDPEVLVQALRRVAGIRARTRAD
jgi:DNA-binding NarL/FixJ family response regulator